MNRPAVPPHYIRRNETSRQPRRWIWLDTEAGSTPIRNGWRQTWLLGVTAFDDFDKRNKTVKPTEWRRHDTPDDLWTYVDARTRKGSRTVLIAHNLAYDLRISECLRCLSSLGWTLDGIRLDGGQAWAVFRRDGRNLTLVDSFSWLPAGLARIGDLIAIAKPPLPDTDDDREVWFARCHADVTIMRTALLRVWQWLERADLGNWQMTSAGTAWAAWRHRFMTHEILVHQDPDARTAEREAAWTGRCEAWKWGRIDHGPHEEWDLANAYAYVAKECEVPTRLRGRMGKIDGRKLSSLIERFHVLARVRVTTDLPLVPARHGTHIVWPIGTFDTILWTPELLLLLERGATVQVKECWIYERAPALAAWAEWVIGVANGEGDGSDPIIRLVAKQWSRSLIGRFGLRYGQWQHAGTSPVSAIQLIPGTNLTDGTTYRILQVGHDVMSELPPLDGENAVPSVMGMVMSECRRRLWSLMVLAGLDTVSYVDTDSLIVSREGATRLAEARQYGLTGECRPKGVWRRLRVLGPRQIVTDDGLRAAGVPKDAEQIAGDTWQAVVWRGLSTSLGRAEPESVRLERREIRLRGTDNRRTHLDGGATAPIVM